MYQSPQATQQALIHAVLDSIIATARTKAAVKIQRVYRQHRLRQPLIGLIPEHGRTAFEAERLKQFANGNNIMRSKWSPSVARFLSLLRERKWLEAFQIDNFPYHAVTLFMLGKIQAWDFYDIIEVWLLLQEFTLAQLKFLDLTFKPDYIAKIFTWKVSSRTKQYENPAQQQCAIQEGLAEQERKKLLFNNFVIVLPLLPNSQEVYQEQQKIFANSENFSILGLNVVDGKLPCLLHSGRMLLTQLSAPYPTAEQRIFSGSLSIDQINAACYDSSGYRRDASVAFPGVPCDARVHGCDASPMAVRLHDWFHMQVNSAHPQPIIKLVLSIVTFIRNNTGHQWSKGIWNILDFWLTMAPDRFFSWLIIELKKFDEFYLTIVYFLQMPSELDLLLDYCFKWHSADDQKKKEKLLHELQFCVDSKVVAQLTAVMVEKQGILHKAFLVKKILSHIQWISHGSPYRSEPIFAIVCFKIDANFIKRYPKYIDYKNELLLVGRTDANAVIDGDSLQSLNQSLSYCTTFSNDSEEDD